MDRKVIVGLCAEHGQRRRKHRTAALTCVVAGMICLGASFLVWHLRSGGVARTVVGIALLVLPVLLLWAASNVAGRVPGLMMSKESKGLVWILGAGAGFLEKIPAQPKQT